MAAYLDIHKPSTSSIHLEITRHNSTIQAHHSCPKQACLLQILSLPVRSRLWCSVRIAIIAPTCHSCRSIMLFFWSWKKSNRLHVLKPHNFYKSPTSVPLSCPSLPNYVSSFSSKICTQLSDHGRDKTFNYNMKRVHHDIKMLRQVLPRASWILPQGSPTVRKIYCILTVSGFSAPCLFVATLNVKGELNTEVCS